MVRRGWVGLVALPLAVLACDGQSKQSATPNVGGSVAGSAAGGSAAGSVEPMLNLGGAGFSEPVSPACHPNMQRTRGEDAPFKCSWVASCFDADCVYGDATRLEPAMLPPALACRQGYEVGLPAGACCYDCVRNQERLDVVTCDEACPETPPSCPSGYRAAPVPGSCCLECVVDQDYCNSDADCVLAKRPANCCACVQSVSVRRLDADDCYSSVSPSRSTPDSCPPDNNCALVDCACPAEIPISAACVEHHCVAR